MLIVGIGLLGFGWLALWLTRKPEKGRSAGSLQGRTLLGRSLAKQLQ